MDNRKKSNLVAILSNPSCADADLRLLESKNVSDRNQLASYRLSPRRYQSYILSRLLDVCTVDEIRRNRVCTDKTGENPVETEKTGENQVETEKTGENPVETEKTGENPVETEKKEEKPGKNKKKG